MGVRISIQGTEIGGNSKVLNNMNASGKVDIDIKDSNIKGDSKVLNNVSTRGTLEYRASNVNIGGNATVMNNRKIREGETVIIRQDGLKHTETTQTAKQKTSNPKTSNPKTTKKEGLLSKIAKILGKEEIESEEIEIDYGKAQKEFANQISGNGKYRNQKYSQVHNIGNEKDITREEQEKDEDSMEK